MNSKGRKVCITQYLYTLKDKPSRVNNEKINRETVWQCIKRAKQGKKECPHCKAIAEEIIEDCFVQGYRILCNDNRKVSLTNLNT